MRAGDMLGIGLAALTRTIAAGAIRRKLRRAALLACLAALAGLALLAGVAAATAALWLWLSAELGQIHAALVMAAGFVAIGVVILLIARLVARRPRRSGPADSLLQWLKTQSKERQGELLLTAILAGFIAGVGSSKPSHSKPDCQ